jgi:hypothetical protein
MKSAAVRMGERRAKSSRTRKIVRRQSDAVFLVGLVMPAIVVDVKVQEMCCSTFPVPAESFYAQ